LATIDRVEAAMDRLEAAEDRIRWRAERADTLVIDALTGLPTQGAGLRLLQKELDSTVGEPYTVALLVADQPTPLAGSLPRNVDSAVCELAQALRAETTGLDLAFCWAGDQIAIGFHGVVADLAAERLHRIASRIFQNGLSLHAGLAERAGSDSPEDLIRHAGDTLGLIAVEEDETGAVPADGSRT